MKFAKSATLGIYFVLDDNAMTQKEQIVGLLKTKSPRTQGELSAEMYGDNKHMPYIYSSLMELVNTGYVKRVGSRPSQYYLIDETFNLKITEEETNSFGSKFDTFTGTSGHVVLLNKLFSGGWLDEDGHIGHEIIDFLLTDDGKYFVYNNPWGACPNDIWIDGTKMLERNSEEKYTGKYMVLTGPTKGHDFDIVYVIELEEKLHRFHTSKDENIYTSHQKEVIQMMKNLDIKYNGKYLNEIYGVESLHLTFIGSKIFKTDSPIRISGLSYKFQRNKGYIYDDKNPDDYLALINKIETSIKDGSLSPFIPRKADQMNARFLNTNKTFFDLAGIQDSEQAYTNILKNILEQGDLLKEFCNRFRCNRPFDSTGHFMVFKETKVVNGRMDVCAESKNQRIVIENKVLSGLNGIRPEDNTSQLSTYFNWAKKKSFDPLCFAIVPNYRINEIKREIIVEDPKMESVYILVSYGDLAGFIEAEFDKGMFSKNYTFYSLIPQIIDGFRNNSYSTKENLYARMFLNATY